MNIKCFGLYIPIQPWQFGVKLVPAKAGKDIIDQ